MSSYLAVCLVVVSIIAGCSAFAWRRSRNARLTEALALSTILTLREGDAAPKTLWDMLNSDEPAEREKGVRMFNQLGWWVPRVDYAEIAAFITTMKAKAGGPAAGTPRGKAFVNTLAGKRKAASQFTCSIEIEIVAPAQFADGREHTVGITVRGVHNPDSSPPVDEPVTLGSFTTQKGGPPWRTRANVSGPPGKYEVEASVDNAYFGRVQITLLPDGRIDRPSLSIPVAPGPPKHIGSGSDYWYE
jgi:hypothetical protein